MGTTARSDANEINVEWSWSDQRPNPTEVYIDSAMTQHMGDVFISFKQAGARLGIFVTADQWHDIDAAARRAIQHRAELTEDGWT